MSDTRTAKAKAFAMLLCSCRDRFSPLSHSNCMETATFSQLNKHSIKARSSPSISMLSAVIAQSVLKTLKVLELQAACCGTYIM